MARPSELRSLEALEQSYCELLLAELTLCALGRWGLFAANPPHPGVCADASVQALVDAGEHIAAFRQRLGFESFAPHARLMTERNLRGENVPGEPKRAKAWLAELRPALDQAEVEELARGWIAWADAAWERQDRGPGPLGDALDAHWDRLADLNLYDPVNSVGVCAAIAELTESEHVLILLGAGPLETLLYQHEEAVLQPFLREAKINPRFRTALRHVWPLGGRARPHWPAFEAICDRLELPKSDAGQRHRPRRPRDR
jgi:hypothetical protein